MHVLVEQLLRSVPGSANPRAPRCSSSTSATLSCPLQVSLRGSSAKEVPRDAFLTRIAEERAARSQGRRKAAAALLIQVSDEDPHSGAISYGIQSRELKAGAFAILQPRSIQTRPVLPYARLSVTWTCSGPLPLSCHLQRIWRGRVEAAAARTRLLQDCDGHPGDPW